MVRPFNRLFAYLLLVLLVLTACGPGNDTSTDTDSDAASADAASADAEYADKMATEHADDSPEASPAATGEPAMAVTTEDVVYATVDGVEVTGYLARPEDAAEGGPAVIVIQEWWGLNDNIRSMARQLAGEGYTALAVDLYGGEVAEDRDTARSLMMAAMENRTAAEDNLRQAHAFLDAQGATKIGSIGWCFGGGWSLNTALMMGEELDAAVIYYGRVVTEAEQLEALATPVLGIFGAEDEGIPLDSVEAFRAASEGLGKDVTVHIYEGADHAFANPSGGRYQAEAAEDAWAKTLTFFAQHLGS